MVSYESHWARHQSDDFRCGGHPHRCAGSLLCHTGAVHSNGYRRCRDDLVRLVAVFNRNRLGTCDLGDQQTFSPPLKQRAADMRESFSRVTATLVESVMGIRVTQGFVRQQENGRIFAELSLDHSRYNSKVLKTHGKFLPLLELNSQIFMAVLLLVGGYRVLTPGNTTEIGDLVGFFFMANLFFSPISILGNQYNQAMTAMAGAERLYRLLDTEPDWTDPPDALQLNTIQGHVEFRNVTFGYDAARPVLQQISFKAKPGEMIALVGHTGSGKSSIINLVCRFYRARCWARADRWP